MPELAFETSNAPFAVSCAVDVVLVALAVWSVRRGRPLPLVAAALLAALAAKGIAMVGLGLDTFGVAHVLWLDLVVVAPVAGVLVVVLLRGPVRALGVLALLLAPLGAYASLVEPERLAIERATVDLPPERAGRAPVRIGVLADLQFERVGDHERAAVAALMRERPDVIVLPGDVHQGSAGSFARELPAIRALLRRLRAPGGVFAVQGDSESVAKLRRAAAGTGVRVLVNETADVRVGDRRVAVAGLELEHWSPFARDLLRRFAAQPGRGDVRVVVAHRPEPVLALPPRTRVDLVVAGHTHGGQVQLPLLGPPFTASNLPRAVAAGGLHELDGRRIYVSRGVGVERSQAPKLRLGAVPEVSVLTLRTAPRTR
ncbi:MAG TPA: metallophosphoesterase [Solirubrobacteraceae bacterium]|nr:metallophosphoesterase [Solirubrobacteraceae bacterium]